MSRKKPLEYKVNCNLPRELMEDLDEAGKRTGWPQADILRACIRMALPILCDLSGLVPMLQPGVLNTTRKREDAPK